MTIQFNQIPGDVVVPGYFAEVNAGPPPYSSVSRVILFGSADPALVAPLTLVSAGSQDPSSVFGWGSMAADMALFARQVYPLGEIYFMGLPTGAGAAKAVGSITFAGTARSNSTFARYIAGERYGCNVKADDPATAVATKFRNAVNRGYIKFNRQMGAPVVASIDGTNPAKVLLTARFAGSEGNDIRIDNGLLDDASSVRGITAAGVDPTGGIGGGDVAAGLAAIAAMKFDFIGGPYNSTGELDSVRDALAERWDPLTSLDGHYFTVRDGSVSALTSAGVLRNDPHTSILGTYKMPHPSWSYAAALTALAAFHKDLGRPLNTAVEIVRPMQGLVLPGFLAPRDPLAIFTPIDRDSLLRSGISTFTFRSDGQVALERIVTTYQTNDAGLEDTTFRDIESVYAAAYVKRYMRNAIVGAYPRCAMMETNTTGIQGVVTPTDIRSLIIHTYDELESAGVVRQADLFAENSRVEFDYENDRMNLFLPVSKSSAGRIFAVNLTLYANLTPQSAQL